MPAVSSNEQAHSPLSQERRSYYRINDAVALNIEKLDAEALPEARDRLKRRELELQALAGKGEGDAQFQAVLRDVESKLPEVANLFRLFESRIDTLVKMVSAQDPSAELQPNTVVSMSGSGLSFKWAEPFYEGDKLLLEVGLFPSRYRFELIAKVVRGKPGDRATDGQYQCALEFVHIAHGDREALLQHIHSLQIQALRSRNDNDY